MAFLNLKLEELECAICVDFYKLAVNLKCGHSFCRLCIKKVLNIQKRSGSFFCPQCMKSFQKRPKIHKNLTLRNLVQDVQAAQLYQEENGIICTYCIHSSVPAVKSCLICEASLCDDHLKVHSKSSEHVLIEPTTSMEDRKCSVHGKILEYFCLEDSACICVSCRLDGEHQGHMVELMYEAFEKKKQMLKNVLQKLMMEREETEMRIIGLTEHSRKIQERAADVTKNVTSLFEDARRHLEDLEMKVHEMIFRQEEQVSLPLSDLIQKLEIMKAELSRKMNRIEELCNMVDPLTFLQESDTGDLCDTDKGDEHKARHDTLLHDGVDLDVAGISHTLHSGLSDMTKGVNVFLRVHAADILLDVNTAHHRLHLSADMKIASCSKVKQNHPETSGKFQTYYQVLGISSFFSGRHYWKIDVSQSGSWAVGMSYASIDRRGRQSPLGYNKKSWSLCRDQNECSVIHNEEKMPLDDKISSDEIMIFLDYEEGRLSFYDLRDPIQHLHTFNATFTEPLHAALCVSDGSLKISESGGNYLPR